MATEMNAPFRPDVLRGPQSHDAQIHWVTSLNKDLYTRYAQKTTNSWPHSAHEYWEGTDTKTHWASWRKRMLKVYPSDDFLYKQWLRFSHKVEAQIETAKQLETGYMIWLDADVEQTQEYTQEWLREQLPKEGEIFTYLHRDNYPETGWIAYNLNEIETHTFLLELEHTYLGNKIFKLEQWHDAYVWWQAYLSVSAMYPEHYKVRSLMDMSVSKGEAFGRSTLKRVFRHHKGPRKDKV